MKFTTTTALAVLAAGQAAVASPHAHAKHHAARHAERLSARSDDGLITKRDVNNLLAAGVSALGLNKLVNPSDGTAWIGNDGPFVNEVFNDGEEDLVFVLWGPWASWVNVKTPQLTVTVASNSSVNVSMPIGMTGGFSAFYNDTKLDYGQVSETWGEFTISPPWTTFDVSRQVNMKGRNMAIVTPVCTTSMTKCVFVCTDGQDKCEHNYDLKNCTIETQAGANKGQDPNLNFAASGGCSGMGETAYIATHLNYHDDLESTF